MVDWKKEFESLLSHCNGDWKLPAKFRKKTKEFNVFYANAVVGAKSAVLPIVSQGGEVKEEAGVKNLGGAIKALKLAYRKHHLLDDTIGWEELSTKLHDALCNLIGTDEYEKWMKSQVDYSGEG